MSSTKEARAGQLARLSNGSSRSASLPTATASGSLVAIVAAKVREPLRTRGHLHSSHQPPKELEGRRSAETHTRRGKSYERRPRGRVPFSCLFSRRILGLMAGLPGRRRNEGRRDEGPLPRPAKVDETDGRSTPTNERDRQAAASERASSIDRSMATHTQGHKQASKRELGLEPTD